MSVLFSDVVYMHIAETLRALVGGHWPDTGCTQPRPTYILWSNVPLPQTFSASTCSKILNTQRWKCRAVVVWNMSALRFGFVRSTVEASSPIMNAKWTPLTLVNVWESGGRFQVERDPAVFATAISADNWQISLANPIRGRWSAGWAQFASHSPPGELCFQIEASYEHVVSFDFLRSFTTTCKMIMLAV